MSEDPAFGAFDLQAPEPPVELDPTDVGVADAAGDLALEPPAVDATPVVPADVSSASDDHPNFDSASDRLIAGRPEEQMAYWHEQEASHSCAVVAQEFVIDARVGDVSERDLCREAETKPWYTPGVGTPLEHFGRLMESHGLAVERSDDASFDELQQRLEAGQNVIVGVDSEEIWTAGRDPLQDDLVGDLPGRPGEDSDHAVEVIGVAEHGGERMVVLNDPGHPDGRGLMVPVAEFEGAWEDCGRTLFATGARVA